MFSHHLVLCWEDVLRDHTRTLSPSVFHSSWVCPGQVWRGWSSWRRWWACRASSALAWWVPRVSLTRRSLSWCWDEGEWSWSELAESDCEAPCLRSPPHTRKGRIQPRILSFLATRCSPLDLACQSQRSCHQPCRSKEYLVLVQSELIGALCLQSYSTTSSSLFLLLWWATKVCCDKINWNKK